MQGSHTTGNNSSLLQVSKPKTETHILVIIEGDTAEIWFNLKPKLGDITGCAVKFGSYQKSANFVPVTQLLKLSEKLIITLYDMGLYHVELEQTMGSWPLP